MCSSSSTLCIYVCVCGARRTLILAESERDTLIHLCSSSTSNRGNLHQISHCLSMCVFNYKYTHLRCFWSSHTHIHSHNEKNEKGRRKQTNTRGWVIFTRKTGAWATSYYIATVCVLQLNYIQRIFTLVLFSTTTIIIIITQGSARVLTRPRHTLGRQTKTLLHHGALLLLSRPSFTRKTHTLPLTESASARLRCTRFCAGRSTRLQDSPTGDTAAPLSSRAIFSLFSAAYERAHTAKIHPPPPALSLLHT